MCEIYKLKSDNITSFYIEKNVGQTMGELIRQAKNQYPHIKMCYSGRLDEMARGLVKILTNDDCRNRQYFDKMDKTYEFTVMMNITTDTTDLLGIIKENNIVSSDNKVDNDKQKVIDEFCKLNGTTFNQSYHNFSSIMVAGKSLWYYALNNTIDTIVIPSKSVTVYSINFDNFGEVTCNNILDRLNLLTESEQLRTTMIKNEWRNTFDLNQKFVTMKFTANVSSGTYIRQLVKDVSIKTNVPLCVYEIYRSNCFFYKMYCNE